MPPGRETATYANILSLSENVIGDGEGSFGLMMPHVEDGCIIIIGRRLGRIRVPLRALPALVRGRHGASYMSHCCRTCAMRMAKCERNAMRCDALRYGGVRNADGGGGGRERRQLRFFVSLSREAVALCPEQLSTCGVA
jgi:hypothetical protein